MGKRERKAERYILSTLPVLYISGRRDFQGGTQQFLSDDAYGRLCTVTDATWGIQGITFNGTSDYISVAFRSLANSDFSIGCWAKRTATGAFHFMIGLGSDAEGNYKNIYLRYSNTDVILWGTNADAPTYTPTTPISGSWVHWMFTQNATSLARVLYENGKQVASNTALAAYSGTGTTLLVGQKSPNGQGQYFAGNIRGVFGATKVLTPSEVQNIMLTTKWG